MTWDEAWEYMRKLYSQTDRFYAIHAAGCYERLLPWNLAGLQEKVRRAIEKKEQSNGQPS